MLSYIKCRPQKQFCFSQATFINVLYFPYQFTHYMYMHKEILLDYFEMPDALFYLILSTSQIFTCNPTPFS